MFDPGLNRRGSSVSKSGLGLRPRPTSRTENSRRFRPRVENSYFKMRALYALKPMHTVASHIPVLKSSRLQGLSLLSIILDYNILPEFRGAVRTFPGVHYL
jgi:hypothetical protein